MITGSDTPESIAERLEAEQRQKDYLAQIEVDRAKRDGTYVEPKEEPKNV